MNTFNTVITWNTKKVSNGFEFNVISVGYQVQTKTHKTGVRSSRAIAKRQAQKWVRYFKQQQQKAA